MRGSIDYPMEPGGAKVGDATPPAAPPSDQGASESGSLPLPPPCGSSAVPPAGSVAEEPTVSLPRRFESDPSPGPSSAASPLFIGAENDVAIATEAQTAMRSGLSCPLGGPPGFQDVKAGLKPAESVPLDQASERTPDVSKLKNAGSAATAVGLNEGGEEDLRFSPAIGSRQEAAAAVVAAAAAATAAALSRAPAPVSLDHSASIAAAREAQEHVLVKMMKPMNDQVRSSAKALAVYPNWMGNPFDLISIV